MNRAPLVAEAFVRGFKVLVRDVACPVFGLYLVLRLGQGAFDVAAIPVIGGLASALIGIPYWSRSDERNRDEDGKPKPRRRRQVTFDSRGVRWGNYDDDDDRSRG